MMKIRRKYSSIRLKRYDYSQSGAYFVTFCTKNQIRYFEDIEAKNITSEAWNVLPRRFPTIILDKFTVMPNHLHFIVWLDPEDVGAQIHCAPEYDSNGIPQQGHKTAIGGKINVNRSRPFLGQIIRSFKSQVTRRIRKSGLKEFSWQRGYYDHVIRNEEALNRIRDYISTNKQRWHLDRYNPDSEGIDHKSIELWDFLKSDDAYLS